MVKHGHVKQSKKKKRGSYPDHRAAHNEKHGKTRNRDTRPPRRQHRVKIERFDPATPLPDVKIPRNILADILEKKDLLVAESLTEHITLRYLRKHPKLVAEVTTPGFMRTSEYEKLRKWVRQELRVLVGMFILEHDLAKLLQAHTGVILANHRSTAERQPYYPGLYEALFAGRNPAVILDLCAGLNPCAYEYLGCTPMYYAIDVSPELMDFVQTFFDKNGIIGKAETADITKRTEFPDADTVLLFKATDVLERVSYGFGEKLLNYFIDKRVIVSFATATIGGGREIAVKKRSWVERWAETNGKSVRIHDIPGERFYILE